MTDRPILFSAPMVRALLAGTKTQTRRLSGMPTIEEMPGLGWHVHNKHGGVMNVEAHDVGKVAAEMLPIQTGDRLWVREAWRIETTAYDCFPPREIPSGQPILYGADADWSLNKSAGRSRPGMFMPRWASRLTLNVTEVRVERLQDISEADAIAEGLLPSKRTPGWTIYPEDSTSSGLSDPRQSYRTLWEAINGPASWEANPWVAAYTFTVAQHNIDEAA